MKKRGMPEKKFRVRAARRKSGVWEILARHNGRFQIEQSAKRIADAGDHVAVIIETGEGNFVRAFVIED